MGRAFFVRCLSFDYQPGARRVVKSDHATPCIVDGCLDRPAIESRTERFFDPVRDSCRIHDAHPRSEDGRDERCAGAGGSSLIAGWGGGFGEAVADGVAEAVGGWEDCHQGGHSSIVGIAQTSEQ
jgi:hypothetical protein